MFWYLSLKKDAIQASFHKISKLSLEARFRKTLDPRSPHPFLADLRSPSLALPSSLDASFPKALCPKHHGARCSKNPHGKAEAKQEALLISIC